MARTPRAKPWERLPTETDPAFEAWTRYRDLGVTRSGAQVAKALGKSDQLIARWSSTHQWVARARSWDVEQDRLWQLELRAARRKAAERNIAIAEAMKGVASQALLQIGQSGRLSEVKAGDIARLVEVAGRLEALAIGSATENVAAVDAAGAGSSMAHVATMTDEERLARMRQLRAEVDARLQDAGEESA